MSRDLLPANQGGDQYLLIRSVPKNGLGFFDNKESRVKFK